MYPQHRRDDRGRFLYAARVRKANALTEAALAECGGDPECCAAVIAEWDTDEWSDLADRAGVHAPSPVTVTMVRHRVEDRARRARCGRR